MYLLCSKLCRHNVSMPNCIWGCCASRCLNHGLWSNVCLGASVDCMCEVLYGDRSSYTHHSNVIGRFNSAPINLNPSRDGNCVLYDSIASTQVVYPLYSFRYNPSVLPLSTALSSVLMIFITLQPT